MRPLPPPRTGSWISLTEPQNIPLSATKYANRTIVSSSTERHQMRPIFSEPEKSSTLRSAISIEALDLIAFTLPAAVEVWHDYQTRLLMLPGPALESLPENPVTSIRDSPGLLLQCALHHIRSLDTFASDSVTTLEALESVGLHRKFCAVLLNPEFDRVIHPENLRIEVTRLLTARHKTVVDHFAGMWPYTGAGPSWLVLTDILGTDQPSGE